MTHRFFKALIAVIIFLPGLSAFTPNGHSQAEKGKGLFRDYCAQCHQLDARGMCMAPSLIGVTSRMSVEEIAAHSRKIADEMMCARRIKDLSDEDFRNIVGYLETLER